MNVLRSLFPLLRLRRAPVALDPITSRWVWHLYPALRQEVAVSLLSDNSLSPHFGYRHFSVSKKDGTPRHLCEPDERLKQIQRALLRQLRDQTPHKAAIGYRRRLSNADHAWAHAGAALIITADIQDFFPSTLDWRIEAWWRDLTDSEACARLLTLLTTYHGVLPQGAPTSPMLSNLVNMPLDAALTRRAAVSGGRYTRYCDDLVFSWQNGEPPSDFEAAVRSTLREFGYHLNRQKGWQIYARADQPLVTGVQLTRGGTVDLPPPMRSAIQRLERSSDPGDRLRLAGYRGYAQSVRRRR